MDDPVTILEKEFCPPLDPALVIALANDFADLDNDQQLASVREVLEPLKESALDEEQNASFDPSGTSGVSIWLEAPDSEHPVDSPAQPQRRSGPSSSLSPSECTDSTTPTSLSNGISSLRLGGSASPSDSEGGYGEDVHHMNHSQKEELLHEIFPSQKSVDIAFILRRCDGDFGRATEELLNHVFLQEGREDGSGAPRGIDGFAEENIGPRRKGRKGKKARRNKDHNEYDLHPPSSPVQRNVWATGSHDIDFLSSRTRVPKETLSSLYHANGASLKQAIRKLVTYDPAIYNPDAPSLDDPILALKTAELVEDFPAILPSDASVLVRIAWPESASAHQLAKALTSSPQQSGRLEIVMQHAPLDLSEETTPSVGSGSVSQFDPHLSYHPTPTSSYHRMARDRAFEQASDYARRGRSDPLMRAAASVSASVGHSHNAAFHASSSTAANALAQAQSTRTSVDLHGVSVNDGVRIAREKVNAWWDGLGEGQEDYRGWRAQGQTGYTIITGRGQHSAGGVGVLGPAVLKMLVREGWKVRVESGAVIVEGVKRR